LNPDTPPAGACTNAAVNCFTTIDGDATIKTDYYKYGFYATDSFLLPDPTNPANFIKQTDSLFRVFFLNTNACLNRNMGLASVREDAGKQLENLVNYLNTFVTYCKTKDTTY